VRRVNDRAFLEGKIMNIRTNSGTITINQRSAYGKFVRAYIGTGAFSGAYTLSRAWKYANMLRTALAEDVSWRAVGLLVGMYANTVSINFPNTLPGYRGIEKQAKF
jgi:hypothetical protein